MITFLKSLALFLVLTLTPVNQSSYVLKSFFDQPSQYTSSFQKYQNIPKQQVLAGIISHHFLAIDLISQFFAGIDPSSVKYVYIVGPDHFGDLTDSLAVSTKLDWQTPFGVLSPSASKINWLASRNIIGLNDQVFANDHSVYTLTPFVKYFFPQANIIPLILKPSSNYSYFNQIGRALQSKNSILIVSSDFSHQSNLDQCHTNDTLSLELLSHKNLAEIDKITCDCPQCIALLYGYLSNQSSQFKLVDNKTSLDYGDVNQNNLTSYISAYYLP